MKVLAVSEDRRNLEEICKLVSDLDLLNGLACHEGSLTGLTNLPVKDEVDILIVDCRRTLKPPLSDLERIMSFYPRLSIVLVVDQESPELLLRALRLGVREVLKNPLSREDLKVALQRILQKSTGGVQGKGEVLAFMSCKGGSGASFIATNLAYVMAEHTDKRVLLIDLNLQFGDAVLYVSDRRPVHSLSEVTRDIQQIDMALLKSALVEVLPNYGILSSPEDPTQAADIRASHVEALIRLARANFDFVVIDVGRSLDTCTIQALDLADHVYPVMQLTLPFLRDARRLFDVFRSLGYGGDKVRPILNRVESSPGDLTERDAEKILSSKIFATIPNHYKSVTASVNQGIPIMKLDRASPVTLQLLELAGQITHIKPPRSKGLISRLFGRS